MIPEFDKIRDEFAYKFSGVDGVLSIDLKENLLRVVVMDESVCANLPSTYFYEPQAFEIGIEYDTTARIAAREAFKREEEERNQKQAIIDELIRDVESGA